MPLLNEEQLRALNEAPPRTCGTCRQAVRRNYCRQCDEFFEAGHMAGCEAGKDHLEHQGHRTY